MMEPIYVVVGYEKIVTGTSVEIAPYETVIGWTTSQETAEKTALAYDSFPLSNKWEDIGIHVLDRSNELEEVIIDDTEA